MYLGDIGHVDEDGHFYIVDRVKELIKYKGLQVHQWNSKLANKNITLQ